MRRDVGYYIEADIKDVYNAYLNAATHEPFERDCKKEPYHSISFGVNFSFKYNMNGGSCNLHFMPYGSGTAVNIRFSIAQGGGARYERYAEDLNKAMQAFLAVTPRKAEYDMDEFLRPENQITPASEPLSAPAPAPAAPQGAANFCAQCGNRLQAGDRFCVQCGNPVVTQNLCPNCKAPAKEGHVFCAQCGTRL